MDNQPQQNQTPQTPQTAAGQNQPQTQQAVQPAAAAQTPASAKPSTPLPKDQTKSNRRLVVGCLGAFGCSILLFIGAILAFLAFGSTENPIFGFLGTAPGQVVDTLIVLINLIFLALVFIAFIFAVVGIFKITAAKKDDKEAKKKGTVMTFLSLVIMVFLIFIWIFVYFFLAPKRTPVVQAAIATEPAATLNLTAPVTIRFDAGRALVNRNLFEILSYAWDFGDETTLMGNPQSHTYEEVGNYKVKLTIALREKATGANSEREFTKDVTIANVRAQVVIKADKTRGVAPLTVRFDGSDSKSDNGEITAYAWDLDEDGEYDDGSESSAQKTFARVGTYKVGLRVTDSTGSFSTGELEIEATVPDTPAAVIAVEGVSGSSTNLEVNKAYMFSGANSTSPTGSIEKYEWDFGDSKKANTRSSTHTFAAVGEYEVTLTVTDSSNKKATARARYSVGLPNSAPVAAITTVPAAQNNEISGRVPLEVSFDASQSQDANNNIVEYEWDFDNDGRTDASGQTARHTFSQAGSYTVKLTITDSTDLTGNAQISARAESRGLGAELSADPISGVVPLSVRFDASGSSYSEGSIVNYEWDFGDGSQPRTDASRISYQYTAIGTFTAKVTAITSDNQRDSAQIVINVRPVPLQACFTPSVTGGAAPIEVEFDPACSTGTVMRYRWNFANLGSSAERRPKFTFRDPGEYEISLEVADNQNVVDLYTKKITVTSRR